MCFLPARTSIQRWRIRTYQVPSDMQTTSLPDPFSANRDPESRIYRFATTKHARDKGRVLSVHLLQALRGSVALAYCPEASRENKSANPSRFHTDTRERSHVMGRSSSDVEA